MGGECERLRRMGREVFGGIVFEHKESMEGHMLRRIPFGVLLMFSLREAGAGPC